MRRILTASILLSPLFISAAALASQPVTDVTASTATRPISTGIKPAHVISTTDVNLTPEAVETLPFGAEVVLKLNVDEKGQPQDIQVVKSPSQSLEGPVADAVRLYRFRPAMLDNQPIETPMTLTVQVQH
jgi:TonB family protein